MNVMACGIVAGFFHMQTNTERKGMYKEYEFEVVP